MTVTIDTITNKPPLNGLGPMDPKHMIAPIYGTPNNLIMPTVCMSVRPNTPKCPPSKKSETVKTSPLRKILPIIAGLLTFATVLSVLIICMDTSEIRLQKFRLNMSRDDEFNDVQQDNPTLVTFIREYHLKMANMHMRNNPLAYPSYNERHAMVPDLAKEIASFVDMKKNGFFVQSLTHQSGVYLTAPWLAEHLEWGGLIVEPDARKYFSLCKENIMQPKVQIIQACVSPNNHPKEITLRNENDDNEHEVRINSLVNGNPLWFNSRVKCYPLFSLMLAVNETRIDLLSLGCQGQELEILESIPFDKVTIKLITIHLNDYNSNETFASSKNVHSIEDYHKKIYQFLQIKSYRLVKIVERNYIYRLIEKNKSKITVTTVKNIKQ